MSRKLMMNNAISDDNKKIDLPCAILGGGLNLGGDIYSITDTSSWDYTLLYTNSNMVVGEKYIGKFIIIERNLTGAYSLSHTANWNVSHNECVLNLDSIENLALGTILETSVFTCYSNSEVAGNRVTGLQFSNANTGSYLKFKMWIEKV